MKRTQQEILNRIKYVKRRDILGFEESDLIAFLDFKNAKKYLNKEYVKKVEAGSEKWEQPNPVSLIKEYLPFAWDKANNCRGISAWRSLCHFAAWLWMDGMEEREIKPLLEEYSYYGKPELVKISEKYGVNWKELDNGEWVQSEYDTPKTSKDVIGK